LNPLVEIILGLGKPSRRSDLAMSRGAVLLLAMVFVLLLAIVATTVMQAAIMQWYMAGNNQFVEEAIAEELSLQPTNFQLTGGVGYANCPPLGNGPECNVRLLTIPESAMVSEAVELDYRVIRQAPLLSKGFPIREPQSTVSSSDRFDAAIFEIDVRIDGSENRSGSAHLVQGIAVRIGAFP
jgi:hypothetical protein